MAKDYRAALVDFYRKHNPIKLVEVDALLRKYKGREEELLHALNVKYKVNEQGETAPEPAKTYTPPPVKSEPPPPPPPPPTPEPEPEPEPEPRPVPRMEAIRNETEEPVRAVERESNNPRLTDEYKGHTAAERAAYWKRELERRELERQKRKREEKTGRREERTVKEERAEIKTKSKQERMKVVREPVMVEEEVDEEAQERKSKTKLVAGIIGGVLLVVVVAAVFLNENLRSKLGFGDDNGAVQVEEKAKKEGLDPGVLGNTADSAKNSGEFALDNEPEDKAPSVEDAMNEQPSSRVNTQEDAKPAADNPPAGTVQRKKFYIGCAAVGTEEMASNMASELRRKGFDNAGYFYIPDYDPNGKALYRVYVGPFETVEEAEENAVNVRSESPSAYAFFLK